MKSSLRYVQDPKDICANFGTKRIWDLQKEHQIGPFTLYDRFLNIAIMDILCMYMHIVFHYILIFLLFIDNLSLH